MPKRDVKTKSTPRDRMLAKAREYTKGTYVRKFVAPEFQRLIRAEDAAKPAAYSKAIIGGGLGAVPRRRGECVCVTCGKLRPWSGGIGRFGGMHTGHFLASRCHSILFEEDNVAPQCSGCNVYRGGMPQQFRLWMKHVRGTRAIERLEKLKGTVRTFTRDELVDMRISYKLRMKEAERVLLSG